MCYYDKRLGQGGYGQVYEGYSLSKKMPVAVKILADR